MTFECPAWLLRRLGIAPASGEESVIGRVELLRPLGSTVLVLLVLLAIGIIVRAYYGADAGSRRGRFILAGLRLFTVAVLLAMLGELAVTMRRAGLPYVLLLIDDSESMNIVDRYADESLRGRLAQRVQSQLGPQSPGDKDAAPPVPASRWNVARTLLLENDAEFLRRLGERNCRLQTFSISDAARRLPADFEELRETLGETKSLGTATRLGDGLRTALDELRGRQIAAVVMFSDGVNTAGPPPADVAALLPDRNSVLYSVGIGETRKAIDVEVADLKVRERVTINDPVSFDFNVIGRGSKGEKVEVVLRREKEKTPLAKKTVVLGQDDVGQPVRLTFRPTETGAFRYVVEVDALPDEATTFNNRASATVEARTDQISVLLVESYPSFEFRYLKQMLARDATVKLTCVLQEADVDYPRTDPSMTTVFPVTLDELLKYDAIIFGDVDPEFLGAASITNLRDYVLERGRGIVFKAGPRFMPQAYRGTPLADLLPIDFNRSEAPGSGETSHGVGVQLTPAAVEEPIFQLADEGGDSKTIWRNLPLLYWHWKVEPRKTAQVMVEATNISAAGEAKSGGRGEPIVLLQRAGRGIVLFHTTDETWRWRFRLGDVYFARYWVQALRYLALAGDGSRPAVLRVSQPEYELGRPVVVEMRYRDDRFVPENGVVSVVVESEGKPSQTVRLAPRTNLRNLFEATLSGLSEGRYRIRPTDSQTAGLAGDSPTEITPVEFTVAAARAESFPIEANFATLNEAAKAGKGEFFHFTDVQELFDKLPRGKLSPTEPLPPLTLWDKWFTILLLVALLTAEWVLRKRRGLV